VDKIFTGDNRFPIQGGKKVRLPEETFQQTADPSVRKAHHLFSFAQSQHSTPPKFPRKGKNQKKELG